MACKAWRLRVHESLKRDPHTGDLYIFRGRRGDLVKILWHDGIGLSLYAKRLDRGSRSRPRHRMARCRYSAAQMAYMLEAIDWKEISSIDLATTERGLSRRKICACCAFGESNAFNL